MAPPTEIPDELWMEIVQASCDLEDDRSYSDFKHQLWQVRTFEKKHQYPVSALPQTSTSFEKLLSKTIYSHPAITYEGEHAIERLSLIIQLCKTLERKIVRDTIESLTLDLRQLDMFYLASAPDLREKWEDDYEMYGEAFPLPTIQDFMRIEDELANKITGLSLVSLGRERFRFVSSS